MSDPDGRYALDLNSSVYGDPYVSGTPYLPSKAEAEGLADTLLPILTDAGRWDLLVAAQHQEAHSRECAEKGWSNGSVWEQYEVAPGDYAALILAVADRPGRYSDTDYRAYVTITSEARDDNDEPLYEATYGL